VRQHLVAFIRRDGVILLAACVIHLDGLSNVARIIDFNTSDQLATAVPRRLPGPGTDPGLENMHWYVGQLSEGLIAAVVEGSADREAIRARFLQLRRQ
jgi:hypothetical protein